MSETSKAKKKRKPWRQVSEEVKQQALERRLDPDRAARRGDTATRSLYRKVEQLETVKGRQSLELVFFRGSIAASQPTEPDGRKRWRAVLYEEIRQWATQGQPGMRKWIWGVAKASAIAGQASNAADSPVQRLDESPARYSSAACSPAEVACASHTGLRNAVEKARDVRVLPAPTLGEIDYLWRLRLGNRALLRFLSDIQ